MTTEETLYDHACMRAELLGLKKPDKDTFIRELREKQALQEKQEDLEIQQLAELERQRESMQNVSGGLDELNSILTVTQKKINRFKTACGSLTNLLKIKVGQSDSTESIPNQTSLDDASNGQQESQGEENSLEHEESGDTTTSVDGEEKKYSSNLRQLDFSKEIDSQVDKLDSLLSKAENAQYSMQYQTKQMKKFINK